MEGQRETWRAVCAPADTDGYQSSAAARLVGPRRSHAVPASAVHAGARSEPEHLAGLELVARARFRPKSPSAPIDPAEQHTLVCPRRSKLPQPSGVDSHTLWLCCSTPEPVCTSTCSTQQGEVFVSWLVKQVQPLQFPQQEQRPEPCAECYRVPASEHPRRPPTR
jgi:hypothetical protein